MKRPTNILVECPAFIASVRVGVLEPLKALENWEKCIVRFIETKHIKKRDITWCDIFISVRGFEYVSMKAAKAAKLAGRFVIYFLDDDLLNVPKDVGSSDYFSSQDNKSALVEIISFSDVIWCVNSLIGEKYSSFNNGRWVLERVPTALFPIQDDEYGVTNILYAGSTDHTSIVREYISPVVKRLCDEMKGGVDFTFIGVDPGIAKCDNVKYLKFFENYDEYEIFLTKKRFHIGLAPVRATEFYQYKYYNKFIEYSKIGAVGIYTDCLPYKLIVRNNDNGFLCQNTLESWYETLKKAIIDDELRKKCMATAYNELQHNFTHDKVVGQLLKDIPELESFCAPRVSDREVKLKNLYFLFYAKRASLLFRKYRVFAVPVLFFKAVKKIIKFYFH